MDVFKKLINEVKKNQILYDRSHEEYNDEEKKNLVWEDIGLITNMTGERAKKKWENIHNAYISSKTSTGGNTNKFANLLGFLEADGNKTPSTFHESTNILEYPEEMSFIEQTSTPKLKKRKREVDTSYAEEEELNQMNVYNSPPLNISTTYVAGQDIDYFCQMIAVRMKTLPEDKIKKIKRQILEIMHKSEIESLSL